MRQHERQKNEKKNKNTRRTHFCNETKNYSHHASTHTRAPQRDDDDEEEEEVKKIILIKNEQR